MNNDLKKELESVRDEIEKLSPEQLALLKKVVRFVDAGMSVTDLFLNDEE